jgi:hypothetical protein
MEKDENSMNLKRDFLSVLISVCLTFGLVTAIFGIPYIPKSIFTLLGGLALIDIGLLAICILNRKI